MFNKAAKSVKVEDNEVEREFSEEFFLNLNFRAR